METYEKIFCPQLPVAEEDDDDDHQGGLHNPPGSGRGRGSQRSILEGSQTF